jgi:hypothetical protein
MPSSLGISPTRYGQPKDQGSKHHQLAIGDPRDRGSQSSEDFTDSPQRYCQPLSLISPLVHHFPGLICVSTNGNALRMIVQVHVVPQRDDDKERGTEQGDVPGLGVDVPKLQ